MSLQGSLTEGEGLLELTPYFGSTQLFVENIIDPFDNKNYI
jgi:hypothetical protein